MQLVIACVVATSVAMIGSALAQTSQKPPVDPLEVKPIPSEAQTVSVDAIRTSIERAGYSEVTDLKRDHLGIWRARARMGDETVEVVVDKGGRVRSAPR